MLINMNKMWYNAVHNVMTSNVSPLILQTLGMDSVYAHLSHTQFVLLTPVMQKSPKYMSNKMVCHCQIYSDFSHKVTTLPKLHFNMSSIYSTQRKSKVWGMNSALLCLLCPMKVVHHSKRLWQSFSKINFFLKDFLLLLCQSVGKPANSERQTRLMYVQEANV